MVFCFRRNSLLDSARRRTEINKLRYYYYYYYKSTYSSSSSSSSFSVNSYLGKPQHSHRLVQCFSTFYPLTGNDGGGGSSGRWFRAHTVFLTATPSTLVGESGRRHRPVSILGEYRRRSSVDRKSCVVRDGGLCSRTHAHTRSTRRTYKQHEPEETRRRLLPWRT